MTDAVAAEFTLTFAEFAEGYQLQRLRKRFISGAPERSHWFGCAWLGGLFVLLLVLIVIAIIVTGRRSSSPAGGTNFESNSPIVIALIVLLPWVVIAAILWLTLARSLVERRMLRGGVIGLLCIGAASSLMTALNASTTQPRPDEPQQSWLSLIGPYAATLCGALVLMAYIRRRTVRVAWDGQPQLRQPVRVEMDEHRLLVQTPLARTEYRWEAVVSFSEGSNVIVLSLSALTFHVIPKCALDAGGLTRVRSLLRSRTVDAQATDLGSAVLPPPPLSPQA